MGNLLMTLLMGFPIIGSDGVLLGYALLKQPLIVYMDALLNQLFLLF